MTTTSPTRTTRGAALVRAALTALPGLLLLAWIAPAVGMLLQGPRDLHDLTPAELEGAYAAANLDTIWDWYAESVSTAADGSTRVTAREYLVPLSDGKTFIGVRVPAARMDRAEAVLRQTGLWRSDPDRYFWDGSYLTVRGSIRPMDEETRALYYDLLTGYYGLEEADLENFPPLVLVDGTVDGLNGSTLTLLGLAGLFLVGLAGVQAARALGLPARKTPPAPPDTWQEP